MQLLKPTEAEGDFGVRALVDVARARGEIPLPARRLIEAARGAFGLKPVDLDSVEPISPDELAEAIGRKELRSQLVNGMIFVSLSSGPPTDDQAALVRRFATGLGVDGPQLELLEKLVHHQLLQFRYCMLRNTHLGDALKTQYRDVGLFGFGKAILSMRGLSEDRELAASFQAWASLPEGTLGNRVFHHFRDNGFSFPGEKHGFPQSIVFHDVGHVLAGYDTTTKGETLITGFQAGYRSARPDGGLFSALFGLSMFSAGVDATFFRAEHLGTGSIGEVADRFFEAIDRGRALSVDLSDDWDYAPYLELPLDEARARLGVPPKTRPTGAGDYPF